eukprot:4133391-Amphidinium_carterae.1
MGCSTMENSFLDQAQAMADSGTGATNALLTNDHPDDTGSLLHDFVCIPLQNYRQKLAEEAASQLAHSEGVEEKPASEKRQLASALKQAQAAELQSYRGELMQKQYRALERLLDASPRRGDL